MYKLVTRYISSAALILIAVGSLLSSGCSASKSANPEVSAGDKAYARAVAMYDKKQYQAAVIGLEPLLYTYRATALEDDVLYLLAQSYYYSGDYLLSAEMYSRLLQQLPSSAYARVSQFMLAKSYEQLSPPADLDQQPTRKAIENFALYIDRYPMKDSSKIATDLETWRELLKINPQNPTYKERYATAIAQFSRIDSLRYSEKSIALLREKLAKNLIVVARKYVQLGKYRAAGIFFDQLVTRYGDTSHVKEAMEGKIDMLMKRQKWFEAGHELDRYLQRFPEKKSVMQGVRDKIAENSKN